MTRRQIVKSAGIGAAAVALRGIDSARAQDPARAASVKALVFDVFGTVVDWRGSIIEEGKAWGKPGASPSIGLALPIDGAPATRLPWTRCEKAKCPGPTSTTCIARCWKTCSRNFTSKVFPKKKRTTGTASGTA